MGVCVCYSEQIGAASSEGGRQRDTRHSHGDCDVIICGDSKDLRRQHQT